MNFLTVSVVLSFVSCLLFTVVVIILGANDIYVSDTLIQYFFMTFGLELGASAAIKITKHFIKKQEIEDKIKNIKENNLTLEKKDLENSGDDNEFEDGIYYG